MESHTHLFEKSKDYNRIEKAIHFIESNFREQPSLGEIASNVGLSEYHFQRLFKRWAGISPKQFLKLLTIEYAKTLVSESRSLLEVAYSSGLSSLGRLHDLFVTVDAVTPGEFKERGKDLEIIYGIHPTPFGLCLLSVTERGICGLSFITDSSEMNALESLRKEWPGAIFFKDPVITGSYINRIFIGVNNNNNSRINLFLKGTNFQIKIWQALMNIPQDSVLTYNDLADILGENCSIGEINNALLNNPVGFIIPCHRIISKIGIIGDYKWGSTRKRAMLGWEAARKLKTEDEDKYIINTDKDSKTIINELKT